MFELFFNANGRISPNTFVRAFGFLTCLGVIASVLNYLVSPNAAIIHFALIGPYVCIYAKRFHDADQSGWFLILVWIASSIAQGIIGGFLLMALLPMFLSPEGAEIWDSVFTASENGEMEVVFEGLQDIMLNNPAPFGRISLFSFILVHVGIALILFNLKQDPKPNSYGPPPL